MRVSIFDLRKDETDELLNKLIEEYYRKLNKDTEVIYHSPRETKIKDCMGCWSCWWKEPGKCALNDEANVLYNDYINSEEVVLLFHTENGFIDGKGKTFLDRLIQHYLPYIQLRDGECGHLKRYANYPLINFYYEKAGLSAEESTVIKNYLTRTAYHFQSSCKEISLDKEQLHMSVQEAAKPFNEILEQEVQKRKPEGRWVIYNGSPRGERSNSKLLIEKIIKGMNAQGIEQIEIRNLNHTKYHATWAEEFTTFENHLFVMPLYVHAMPGSVMKFFERLKPTENKKIHMAFLVQSGFPETSQSYYLRPYLELLTKRLGASFDGIIIKGGVEGIQMKPEKANKKLFDQMEVIGRTYAEKGIMDKAIKMEYAKEAYLSKATQIIFTLLSFTGLTNFYWNYNLKKNGAYEKRYAKPYRK